MRARAAYAAGSVLLAVAGLVLGLFATDLGSAAASGRFVFTGTVSRVVEGDTLDVILASGKRERVRLIGIDAPERGACYFSQATARARQLALRKRVTLRGDPTQATRDRNGRLLGYVLIGARVDLGLTLIRQGFGRVYVDSRPFARVSSYRRAEAAAKASARGLWASCGAKVPVVPTPPPTTTATPTLPPTVPTVPTIPPVTTAAAPPTHHDDERGVTRHIHRLRSTATARCGLRSIPHRRCAVFHPTRTGSTATRTASAAKASLGNAPAHACKSTA